MPAAMRLLAVVAVLAGLFVAARTWPPEIDFLDLRYRCSLEASRLGRSTAECERIPREHPFVAYAVPIGFAASGAFYALLLFGFGRLLEDAAEAREQLRRVTAAMGLSELRPSAAAPAPAPATEPAEGDRRIT